MILKSHKEKNMQFSKPSYLTKLIPFTNCVYRLIIVKWNFIKDPTNPTCKFWFKLHYRSFLLMQVFLLSTRLYLFVLFCGPLFSSFLPFIEPIFSCRSKAPCLVCLVVNPALGRLPQLYNHFDFENILPSWPTPP